MDYDAALAAPYDRIAERWSREREVLEREQRYIDRLASLVVPGGRVLDLGCGSGLIARGLLDRGLAVTGVDASRRMLELARRRCPEAALIHADMLEVAPGGPYQGIVAWDSAFHVPRDRHALLYRSMAGWLDQGAPLLLSIGGTGDEFTAPMMGVDFFYSAHPPEAALGLLREAGFDVVAAEVDDPTSRGHVAVLCVKRGPA